MHTKVSYASFFFFLIFLHGEDRVAMAGQLLLGHSGGSLVAAAGECCYYSTYFFCHVVLHPGHTWLLGCGFAIAQWLGLYFGKATMGC